MDWKISLDIPNSLVVTAHPDDETIFCGGTILSFPSWSWNIVCITMQTHTVRPQEFKEAMEMYKNAGVNINSWLTLGKRDDGQDLSPSEIADWKTSLEQFKLTPDVVFTHNIMGEYGHNHHMNLNQIVHSLFSNVWDFVYPGDDRIDPQPTKTNVNETILSQEILNKKIGIFENCYKSQSPGLWTDPWKAIMEYEFKKGPEIFTSD